MYGLHIKQKQNLLDEIKKFNKLNCTIFQFFVNNIKNEIKNAKKINSFIIQNNIKLVCHISYTINCARNWSTTSWWIKQFQTEIEIASKIGAIYVVVHLGKQLNLTKEEALNNMFQSMLYIHTLTLKHSHVKILFETSSGSGTELCYNIEDLGNFFKKFSQHKSQEIRERFGICLDTCHVFAAGNDITNNLKIKKFLKLLDEKINLQNIKLIHLNDSKNFLNEKIDRHDNLGNGKIGKKNLQILIKFFSYLNIPMVLETPVHYILNDLLILKKNIEKKY